MESDQQVAQTFKVGLAGRLVGIDVQIRTSNAAPPTEDPVLDVRSTFGGLPVEDDTLGLAMYRYKPKTFLPSSR